MVFHTCEEGKNKTFVLPTRLNFKETKCYSCQSIIMPLNAYIQRRNDIFRDFRFIDSERSERRKMRFIILYSVHYAILRIKF